jgi:hypothetical protein
MNDHYTQDRLESLLKSWDDKPNEPRVLVCDCSLLHLDDDDQGVCSCGRLLLRTQWLLSGEFADVYQAIPPLMRELLAARAENAILLDLIRDLAHDDACEYDHHGYCQSHFLHERPCPHERAQAILQQREDT